MEYVYKRTESTLWTVGYYDPDGKWYPESDHVDKSDAAERVHYMNGGIDAAEQRAAQLEAEREMYKQGFDALTAANEQIVKERDEASRALAQHQTTRAELLDTIEKLKRENEQLQSEIDYLRSTDHAADLAFERAQKIGARYVIDETPLGIALDGQGDEVEP